MSIIEVVLRKFLAHRKFPIDMSHVSIWPASSSFSPFSFPVKHKAVVVVAQVGREVEKHE